MSNYPLAIIGIIILVSILIILYVSKPPDLTNEIPDGSEFLIDERFRP